MSDGYPREKRRLTGLITPGASPPWVAHARVAEITKAIDAAWFTIKQHRSFVVVVVDLVSTMISVSTSDGKYEG